MNTVLATVVVLICSGALSLSSADTITSTTAPVKKSQPVKKVVTSKFSLLEQKIDSYYSQHASAWGLATLDTYSAVKKRLQHAHRQFKNRDTKPSDSEFQLCSLQTELVLLLMKTDIIESKNIHLDATADSLSDVIKDYLESINGIEKSLILTLEEQLGNEKQRALSLQKEAADRFFQLQNELIQVKQDARGTIISMSDILFDVNKATLSNELKNNLAKIAGILTVYKDANVVIEGHTDSSGTEKYNQLLSEQRALNVLKFLSDQGIAPQRLSSVGYGFFRPVSTNATPDGRQKNRRVDLIVREKKLNE